MNTTPEDFIEKMNSLMEQHLHNKESATKMYIILKRIEGKSNSVKLVIFIKELLEKSDKLWILVSLNVTKMLYIFFFLFVITSIDQPLFILNFDLPFLQNNLP